MMCAWMTLWLLLLSLIASVLCWILVLLIDSRCSTSLVIMCHRTENYFNCVVKSVFCLFHMVPWVNMQPVFLAFSTHSHSLKNIRLQSRQYQTFTNVGGKCCKGYITFQYTLSLNSKYRFRHYVRVLEISHCLQRTLPMQIVCQHLFLMCHIHNNVKEKQI